MVRMRDCFRGVYVWGDDTLLDAPMDSYVLVEEESIYAEPMYYVKRSNLTRAELNVEILS